PYVLMSSPFSYWWTRPLMMTNRWLGWIPTSRIVSPERKYAMSTLSRTSVFSDGSRLSKGDAEKLKALGMVKRSVAYSPFNHVRRLCQLDRPPVHPLVQRMADLRRFASPPIFTCCIGARSTTIRNGCGGESGEALAIARQSVLG